MSELTDTRESLGRLRTWIRATREEGLGPMGTDLETLRGIADELNAALGGGECVPHGEWESISQTQEVRHVFCECGHELGMDRRDSLLFERTQLFAMPNYCQECGRKIRKAVKR